MTDLVDCKKTLEEDVAEAISKFTEKASPHYNDVIRSRAIISCLHGIITGYQMHLESLIRNTDYFMQKFEDEQ